MSDVTRAVPRSAITTFAARQMRAVGYLCGNLLAGLLGLVLVLASVVVLALSLVGVGLFLLGPLGLLVRRWCDRERTRIGRVLRRRIDSPYVGESGSSLSAARSYAASGRLARDAYSVFLRVLLGPLLGVAAIALPLFSLNYGLFPLYWWALPEGESAVFFVVTSWPEAIASGLLGLGAFVLWTMAPAVSSLDAKGAAMLLSPGQAQEQRRRAEIESVRRKSAVSAHSAELRRIERDLHDAAQNRLVAVAMFVGMAQRQLGSGTADPSDSLTKASRAASDAIADVRRIIHGIYPPVLAEEGLVPAVGLLVDQSQIPTRLHVDRLGSTPAAVDAALYFSIAELLTNVAKHSSAREATVELHGKVVEHVPWVSAVVDDDGHGGVDPCRGTGLAGVQNRIAALGGSLTVTSPRGGPTRIEVSLPCES